MPGARPSRGQFVALFTAVMLPMFLAAVDQTVLATATPRIAAEFGGLADTAWIAVGYLLAATVMAPVYGRLGDRFGRQRVLLVALTVFAAGSLACAAANGMLMLVLARALQGLGGGGLMVMSQALIGEVIEPRHRPRYQLYFAGVFTVSSVGGPIIGGLVVNHASWRWLFIVNLPLCLLAAWRVSRLRPVAARARAAPGGAVVRDLPLDPVGVVLFALTAASALLWFSFVGHRFALASGPSVALAAVALCGAVLLWRQQRHRAAPFLPLDILRVPGVLWICASVLAFAATMFALIYLLPIYLQVGHGASAARAGALLLPLTGGLVLGATINGRIVARTGIIGVLPPYGMGLTAAGLLVLASAPPTPALITVAAGVCGIGLGAVMPNAQLSTQVLAGRSHLGAAAALVSLTRSLGASLGTAAFGGLVFVLLQAGREGVTGGGTGQLLEGLNAAQITRAFHLVFVLLAAFVLLGAWAARHAPRLSLEGSAPDAPVAEA